MLTQAASPHHPSPTAPVIRRLYGYQQAILALTIATHLLVAAATVVLYDRLREAVTAAGPRTLTTPETFGGRARVVGDAADALIADAMRGQPSWEGHVEIKGVYGDSGDRVLLHAVEDAFDPGPDALTWIFYDLRVAEIAVADVAPVPAGPLGGDTACAQVRANEHGATAVCAWVDTDTFGTIVWYGASMEAARAEFTALRGEVEIVGPASAW